MCVRVCLPDSWVHCNDAKMEVCSLEEVRRSQAYILLYTQRAPPSPPPQQDDDDPEVTFNFRNSSIPKFVELKRRLGRDSKGRYELKRRKTTVW